MKYLNKIQTAIRLLIVGLLVYPMPIAMAVEQTETESFGNGVWANSNFSATNYSSASYSIDNYFDGDYGCDGYCLNYNINNVSNRMLQITFADTGITEIGFDVGAVDSAWHYNVFIKDANGTSSNPDWITYNDTSSWDPSTYVFEETYTAPTGYEIWRIEMNFSDYAIIDNFYYKYDDGITAGTGAPTNLTVSTNLHNGSITIDWDAPANTYQYSPERYAIGFDKADPPMYGIATGNVGDENALNTEYTFTKSYLQSALDAQVGDTLYFKIRSDNDTNSSYSSWTTIASYTIQDVASGVTDLLITNNEYQGLKLGWIQPNTGWSEVESYKIKYKLSSEETWTSIVTEDPNTTSYLIEDIEGGTYDFVVYACTQNGSWCHGNQGGLVNNFEVLATTAVTTTTTTTLPPPPPPPPPAPTTTLAPVEVVVMDDGTEAEYTTDQIAQGDVERDNERKANEEKWGCYVTNIALERGDCEAYNEAIAEPEEEIIEEEVIDDKIIEEEIKDEKIVEEIIEDDTTDNIVDDIVVEDDKTEEVVDEIEITTTTTVPKITTTTTQPIKEDFVDKDTIEQEVEIIEDVISEEFTEELTEEEIELLITETEDLVKEILVVEVIEDEPVEEFEAKVEQAVKELPKEKKVEVVKEVAKVSVQNLATADNTTKAVVKAVVKEVTKPETVAQLSEEEKKDVGKVLGFQDETAADDVEIIAVQAEKEPAIAEAVAEYVDRAIENKDVENYTLADVVTEVQVEAFIADPIGAIIDIDLTNIKLSELGNDMTQDQKEKAQEVVVPVIIASQIIAQAGALIRRPF